MSTPSESPVRTAAPDDRRPDVSYDFLMGRGRSGTNWISQILNRYRRCHFKHEPFSEYKVASAFRDWLDDLDSRDDDELRRRFRVLCESCFHDIDYPPFYRKSCRTQSPLLLRATWQVGKLAPGARGLYEWYGRPHFRPGDSVFIKQVNFPNERLDRFAEVVSPRLVALVRNPFSSVSSAFRFNQPSGEPLRTEKSLGRVVGLMPTMEEFGVRYTRDELMNMSESAFEAVRWRIQSEPLAAFAHRHADSLLARYEDFATDPEKMSRELFRFYGWQFDEEIVDFLKRTTQDKTPAIKKLGDARFSIYRDPKATMTRWKKDLSPEQIHDIERVVAGSKLLELWPELAS
jgi:hypothetical protein